MTGTRRYAAFVERAITGYHRDGDGDWIAELSCGHGQHVRHRPPFQLRPWVLSGEGRTTRLGVTLDCLRCDRAELPQGLLVVCSSPEWDEQTMPVGLLRSHRIENGMWGRLSVSQGELQYTARREPALDVVLGSGAVQAIPPEVKHDIRPLGQVRFSITLLAIDEPDPTAATADASRHEAGGSAPAQPAPHEGGESACWAHLLCPECGAILDGGCHIEGCRSAPDPACFR